MNRLVATPLLSALLLGFVGCAARAPLAEPPALRIYLARHGQTDWNVAHRMQGQTDTDLNATGRAQAEELKWRLAGVRLDAVYSSALKRSRETAEIARGAAPLESLAGLNEQGVGTFEGKIVDSSAPEVQTEWDRRSADPDDALDGGESASQFYARVKTTIEGIRARRSAGTILIVGHGGTNTQILRALLGLTAEQARTIRQANDELYLIELTPGRAPRLWKLIDDRHLAEL